jgi:hypothetical protein
MAAKAVGSDTVESLACCARARAHSEPLVLVTRAYVQQPIPRGADAMARSVLLGKHGDGPARFRLTVRPPSPPRKDAHQHSAPPLRVERQVFPITPRRLRAPPTLFMRRRRMVASQCVVLSTMPPYLRSAATNTPRTRLVGETCSSNMVRASTCPVMGSVPFETRFVCAERKRVTACDDPLLQLAQTCDAEQTAQDTRERDAVLIQERDSAS